MPTCPLENLAKLISFAKHLSPLSCVSRCMGSSVTPGSQDSLRAKRSSVVIIVPSCHVVCLPVKADDYCYLVNEFEKVASMKSDSGSGDDGAVFSDDLASAMLAVTQRINSLVALKGRIVSDLVDVTKKHLLPAEKPTTLPEGESEQKELLSKYDLAEQELVGIEDLLLGSKTACPTAALTLNEVLKSVREVVDGLKKAGRTSLKWNASSV